MPLINACTMRYRWQHCSRDDARKVRHPVERGQRRHCGGLKEILVSIEKGEFSFDVALEDIHMNIEKRLTDAIGRSGRAPSYGSQPQ